MKALRRKTKSNTDDWRQCFLRRTQRLLDCSSQPRWWMEDVIAISHLLSIQNVGGIRRKKIGADIFQFRDVVAVDSKAPVAVAGDDNPI